jgi:hypothetical protein
MSFACWIIEATDTHSEYIILIAFLRQRWLRERASFYIIRKVPVLLDISVTFQERRNFSNSVGNIDVKHVRIKHPLKAGSEFCNYKQFLGAFSILRQATIRFVKFVCPHGVSRLPWDGFSQPLGLADIGLLPGIMSHPHPSASKFIIIAQWEPCNPILEI